MDGVRFALRARCRGSRLLLGRELEMDFEGLVYIVPPVSNCIGGDIISVLLATQLHRQEEPGLFFDIGTKRAGILLLDYARLADVQFASIPDFLVRMQAAKFIPHTDLRRFPVIGERLP